MFGMTSPPLYVYTAYVDTARVSSPRGRILHEMAMGIRLDAVS